MIHPNGKGTTFLGKANPDTLHFNCPECGKEFKWNITTKTTEIVKLAQNKGCMLLIVFILSSIFAGINCIILYIFLISNH